MNYIIKFALSKLLASDILTGKERGMIKNIVKTKL